MHLQSKIIDYALSVLTRKYITNQFTYSRTFGTTRSLPVFLLCFSSSSYLPASLIVSLIRDRPDRKSHPLPLPSPRLYTSHWLPLFLRHPIEGRPRRTRSEVFPDWLLLPALLWDFRQRREFLANRQNQLRLLFECRIWDVPATPRHLDAKFEVGGGGGMMEEEE